MTDPAAPPPEPAPDGSDDAAQAAPASPPETATAASAEPAPSAESVASAEPATSATPAPAATNAAPAQPTSPPWTPPETFADRFSRWSVAAVRGAVATFGLVSLVLFVLWLVPMVAVARSDAYRIARERVANDALLQRFAGAPIVCDRMPDWYDVRSPDGQRFRFDAQGASGSLEVEVVVRDGKAEIASAYLGARGF